MIINLYRAQSIRHIPNPQGIFKNPNEDRQRKPRDTAISTHNAIGIWFQKKFGINYREKAIFCTGNISIARGYVNPTSALIELRPIGDFSLCFSPKCKDLFGYLQFRALAESELISAVDSEMEDLGYIQYKNCGLEEAAASGNEVMLIAAQFDYKKI